MHSPINDILNNTLFGIPKNDDIAYEDAIVMVINNINSIDNDE